MQITQHRQSSQNVSSVLNPEGIRTLGRLEEEAERDLARLLTTLSKIEGTRSKLVSELGQAVRAGKIGDVTYQTLPKHIDELTRDWLMASLSRFIQPRGVRIQQQNTRLKDRDPLV